MIDRKFKERRTYDFEFTELFFQVGSSLRDATVYPHIENIKAAWADVNAIASMLTHRHEKDFDDKIKPKLEDIENILYGKLDDIEVMKLCKKYKVRIKKSDTRKRGIMLENAQNILHELWDIFRKVKEWAREQDLFAKEPMEEIEDEIEGYS